MGFLKWPKSRAKRHVPVDDEDESASGGYLVNVESGAPRMTLTEPIESMRAETFSVSVSPHLLPPGRHYLLGGPGELTCEVVQVVETAEPTSGEPRRIRRGRFRTIASTHPVGTPVTPVTAERIEDWSQWVADDAARPADQ